MKDDKCFGCADCCRVLKVSAALDDKFKEFFSAHFNRSIAKVSFRIKHDCVQLSDGRCVIYENRPVICRDHFCNRERDEMLELEVVAEGNI